MSELMTAREAAELLRMTLGALYAAAERGQLPGIVRIGKRLRFRTEVLRRSLGLVSDPPSVPPQKKRQR